jgi:Putative Flp pilus-assembly TadE/G-like
MKWDLSPGGAVMFESTYSSLKQIVIRFIAEREASVLPTFALVLIPLLAGVGAAVDYSRASQIRTSLQSILDSAVLAGAHDGSTTWANTATNFFNGNTQTWGASVASPAFTLTSERAYSGSVSATVPTYFLGALGIKSINISATATAAVTSKSGAYYCVMALNTSAQAALQLTGNASITVEAPNCVVQVNSSNSDAVNMTGNASISSSKNCFVGGIDTVGNSSISPSPDPTCSKNKIQIPDPFANYPKPAVGPCDYTNFSLSGSQTVTLQPGVYCGGMNFSGPVNVTFAPGLYVVENGVISESGGSFTGNGVTFFLTGQGASVQLSGQANWHIVAPASGEDGMPGFAIFLDPNGPTGIAGEFSTLSGQSELYFEGIVYLPKQQVTVTGTAVAFSPSPYTSYIGDTLNFVGNGELVINNDTTMTSVPIPTALEVQTGGQIALAQ